MDATLRGEVGELVALRDVVLRLVDASRTDPEPTVRALSRACSFANGLRARERQGPVPAPADLAKELAAARAGDRTALDTLADRLDISRDRGPGFDLVDPLGSLQGLGAVHPARVEVKTTAAAVPQGGTVFFRLTVNELFQSNHGNEPYVVRVYHDPGDDRLPLLQAEISDPVSLVPGLGSEAARAVLALVRGGGHIGLTARLTEG